MVKNFYKNNLSFHPTNTKYINLLNNAFYSNFYFNKALNNYNINYTISDILIKEQQLNKIVYVYLKSFFFKLENFRDLSIIDRLEFFSSGRYLMKYNFLSLTYAVRCFLKFIRGNNFYFLKSLNFLYSSSIWIEREAWDMFGFWFIGNVDMRRILTDYGFQDHPLRKDFPLTGFKEISYKHSFRRLVYSRVVLAQEYRVFSVHKSWSNNVLS